VKDSTSEGEQDLTSTSGELEPTSETTPEMFSKEDVAKQVSDAEARVQSSKDLELATERRKHRDEVRTIKAQQEQAQLEVLERTEQERFGDSDPDLLKEIHELRRRVHLTATETSDVQAHGYAYRIGKQYGVDPEVLLDSASKEEMEAKAKELTEVARTEADKARGEKIKQLEEELAIAKKPPEHIDSSAPSATGTDWRELSPEGKLRKGLEKMK